MLSKVQRKRAAHAMKGSSVGIPYRSMCSPVVCQSTQSTLPHLTIKRNYLREGGMPTVDSFMASGPFSRGCMLGGGGGPLLGCLRRNSWLGVCPKWLI